MLPGLPACDLRDCLNEEYTHHGAFVSEEIAKRAMNCNGIPGQIHYCCADGDRYSVDGWYYFCMPLFGAHGEYSS